jgi:hypothetical protein
VINFLDDSIHEWVEVEVLAVRLGSGDWYEYKLQGVGWWKDVAE